MTVPLSQRFSFIRPIGWLVVGFVIGFAWRASFKTAVQRLVEPNQRPVASESLSKNSANGLMGERTPELRNALAAFRAFSVKPPDLLGALALVSELSVAECKEAVDLFSHWPMPERQVMQEALWRRWARLDPMGIFVDKTVSDFPFQQAARGLADRDSIGALTNLAGILNPDRRFTAMFLILQKISESNPSVSADYLSTHQNSFDVGVFREVGFHFAHQNPEKAFEWARGLTNWNLRRWALDTVWDVSSAADPVGTAAALKASGQSDLPRDRVYTTLARTWSQKDPVAAAAWIKDLPLNKQESAWKEFRLGDNRPSPEAISKILESIPPGDSRSQLVWKFAGQMAREDVSTALQWSEQIPVAETRDRALSTVVNEWSLSDPRAAVQYVADLPDAASRSNLLGHSMSLWAKADNNSALRWAEQLAAGSERDLVAKETIKSLRPDEASKWFNLMQDSPMRTATAERIVWAWADQDPQNAAQWISSLSPGTTRDSAISVYTQVLNRYDPATATQWAAKIEDTHLRSETTTPSFKRWLRETDPAEARSWLSTATLDDETRAALLQISGQGPDQNANK
jgi:hypothetical protein